jgi:hypothetical protein
MAIDYWDYQLTTTGSTTTDWSGTATVSASTGTSTVTTALWPTYVSTFRRYIVAAPKSWDRKTRAIFTKLVNDDTDTGFTVDMWIDGDIEITDPTIEKRTMEDFMPLLKHRASEKEKVLISDFFEKYHFKDGD